MRRRRSKRGHNPTSVIRLMMRCCLHGWRIRNGSVLWQGPRGLNGCRRRRWLRASTFEFQPLCTFARITSRRVGSLSASLNTGLLHVGTELLVKAPISEYLPVFLPNGPLSPTQSTISNDLPETYSGTENMSDAVHPCLLAALEMGIDDGDPIIDFLQCQTLLG